VLESEEAIDGFLSNDERIYEASVVSDEKLRRAPKELQSFFYSVFGTILLLAV
jgi:hypothetical protein